VIAYDHRGHGRSDSAATSTYTPDRLADVLDALQVRSPMTLAGHSMGGMAALSYLSLAHMPIEPVGLVLVGTAASGLTNCGLGRLLALPGLDAAMSLASHAPRGLSTRVLRGVAGPLCGIVTRDRAVSTSLAHAVRCTPASTVLGFLHALKTYDRHSVLATITASTTVISGGEDLLTPTAHSDVMAAAIPGATRIHLPSAGHMLLHEAAGVVSDAILRTVTNADVGHVPPHQLNHRPAATSA
jgi:pimeloyl-ACP methyl ester carboxylesterase